MGAMLVVVALEIQELHLQISACPEERAVQTFPSNRTNHAFDEGMGKRRVGHRLDFFDVEDAQIRLPSVEFEQPIMIGTEVRRWRLASYRAVEHATQPHASTGPRCTPKPTIRRVYWSITTSTQ